MHYYVLWKHVVMLTVILCTVIHCTTILDQLICFIWKRKWWPLSITFDFPQLPLVCKVNIYHYSVLWQTFPHSWCYTGHFTNVGFRSKFTLYSRLMFVYIHEWYKQKQIFIGQLMISWWIKLIYFLYEDSK